MIAKVIGIFLCKDPVIFEVEEKTEVALKLSEPGSGGSYEEITWSKDRTGSSQYRIVYLIPEINGGTPMYYNDFCSGSSPCDTSDKVELNITIGELTIYHVNISDEGFYYYYFFMGNGGTPDTGYKYEIDMEVYGKSIYTLFETFQSFTIIVITPI